MSDEVPEDEPRPHPGRARPGIVSGLRRSPVELGRLSCEEMERQDTRAARTWFHLQRGRRTAGLLGVSVCAQLSLFGSHRGWCSPDAVSGLLDKHHYLGRTSRGLAWTDSRGCLVVGPPTSRYLPSMWLDLTRWCILSGSGSQQWAEVRREIMARFPECTTVVSYSDPKAGHDGALYRACNWRWAPTWHRLRPPPTGHGSWSTGKAEGVKDRWVDCLRPDPNRHEVLRVKDSSVLRRWPMADWREPRIKRGRVVRGTGGGDYAAWLKSSSS